MRGQRGVREAQRQGGQPGAAVRSGAMLEAVIGGTDELTTGSGTLRRRASRRSQRAGEMLGGLLVLISSVS